MANNPKDIFSFTDIDKSKVKSIDEEYDISFSNEEIQAFSLEYINNIEKYEVEFAQKTKLDGVDKTFLFFVIALQVARQYLLTNEKFRFDKATDGDALMKKIIPKSHQEILLQSVPYDALKLGEYFKGENLSAGLSGANHRYMTLGHDPILGWIFGTANILTETLTKTDFTSYNVRNMQIINQTSTLEIFQNTFEISKNDVSLLGCGILRQAVHFGSDYFTKMGLPIPILPTLSDISPSYVGKLMGENARIDAYSITRGATLSALINFIASFAHNLFFDIEKHHSKELYECKTRKILLYSNLIATGSNVIYTSMRKDLTKLDVGGFIVTLYRIYSDTKFIKKIKEEFVNTQISEEIQKEIDEIDKKIESLLNELGYSNI